MTWIDQALCIIFGFAIAKFLEKHKDFSQFKVYQNQIDKLNVQTTAAMESALFYRNDSAAMRLKHEDYGPVKRPSEKDIDFLMKKLEEACKESNIQQA